MCKIMVMSGIKKDKVSKAWDFARVMAPRLSNGNDDGFGYAAQNSKGEVFAERWLDNKVALVPNMGFSSGDIKLINGLGTEFFKETFKFDYNKHEIIKDDGKGFLPKDDIVSLMLHARRSTNEKTMKNTHPFIKNNVAVIHNGVIRNDDKLTKEMSTCDSEVILHEYLQFNVAQDASQFHGVVDQLQGYYGLGIMAVNAEGLPIVDVVKSPGAMLYATYVNELETFVFCTSSYDLDNGLGELNWKKNKILELSSDIFMRFNAITGEKLDGFTIKSNENVVNFNSKSGFSRSELDESIDRHKNAIDYVKLMEEEEIRRNTASGNFM